VQEVPLVSQRSFPLFVRSAPFPPLLRSGIALSVDGKRALGPGPRDFVHLRPAVISYFIASRV